MTLTGDARASLTPVTHGGNPLGASLSLWEKTAVAGSPMIND
ncbi:hypothetical protein [Nostoc sp.]